MLCSHRQKGQSDGGRKRPERDGIGNMKEVT